MDITLRARHLRLWVVLGPLLVIGTLMLLALRPPAAGRTHADAPGRIGTGDAP